MQITGTIKVLFEERQVSDKYRKREVVVTDSSTQYPQHILVQFSNDKIQFLDQFQEGDQVTVHINLRGREWTSPQGETKYFNTLEGWKISGGNAVSENDTAQVSKNGGEDLPF